MLVTDRVVELLATHGCVADPEAAAHIARQPDPETYIRRMLAAFLEVPFRLTLDQLLGAEALIAPEPPPPPSAVRSRVVPTSLVADVPKEFNAGDHDAEIELLSDAGRSRAPQGDLSDFVRYFNDRYDALTSMLRRRREVAHASPIARLREAGREAVVYGLIDSMERSGKSGHRFLTLEDNTGSLTLLVHASRPDLVAMADSLLPDEVVGVKVRVGKQGSLVVAEQIIRPDLPMRADTRPPMEVPLAAAFLSDIHMGSTTFLSDSFKRMLRWLHGDQGPARERALARSIKYVVLPGDIVDGVGVYPGQEDSLRIPHILEQYRQLARELETLPRHLHVVIQPGNHDASRPNEPQPAFDAEIRGFFDALEATFVSNPSTIALHSRRVLSYHGFSMIDFATRVPGLSVEHPTDIMRQMLQCRHVAPAFGAKTPIAPESPDRLVISLEPDVFVTGHVHVVGMDRYRGTSLVNAGAWQAQTSYQKMHNLTPTPSILPVVNLSTFQHARIDFSAAS